MNARRWIVRVGVLLVLLVLPRMIYPILAVDILAWGLFALAFDLVFGYVGLLSFGLNYQEVRWWRVLTFGFFLLLSAVAVRAVPFFAVTAGLVMALNFHDFAERRQAARGERGRRELALGRVLVALTLVRLLTQ